MDEKNEITLELNNIQCALVKVIIEKFVRDNLYEMADKKIIYDNLQRYFKSYLKYDVNLEVEYDYTANIIGKVIIPCDDGIIRIVDFYMTTKQNTFKV